MFVKRAVSKRPSLKIVFSSRSNGGTAMRYTTAAAAAAKARRAWEFCPTAPSSSKPCRRRATRERTCACTECATWATSRRVCWQWSKVGDDLMCVCDRCALNFQLALFAVWPNRQSSRFEASSECLRCSINPSAWKRGKCLMWRKC